MQIGAHGLVFTGEFDEAGLRRAVEGTARAGFDLIEIPLMDPDGFDSALAGRMIAWPSPPRSASPRPPT